MKQPRLTAYAFFLRQAGYSWRADVETRTQGRRRCARALADAESRVREAGCSFDWSIDPDIDSSSWSAERPAWQLWECVARDPSGTVFASLSGIDFGRNGSPWGDPYRRVVEAELATEYTA